MKRTGGATGRGPFGSWATSRWLAPLSEALATALATAALALTLAALLTALARLRAPPAIPASVSFGWTDGHDGQFQVLADACNDGPFGVDAVVSASLTHGSSLTEFRPPAVDDTPADLEFAAAVPVLSFEPSALAALTGNTGVGQSDSRHDLVETALSRVSVRCRSHAESSARFSRAAFALVPSRAPEDEQPPGPVPIGVTSRRVPPASDLLGVLVLNNDGDESITLRALRYAPNRSSSGRVLAAAGDRALVASWLGAVFEAPHARALSGTVDPSTLTPWDAAYQDEADPRALRERDADRLHLEVRPGEMAMIVVGERSLAPTLAPRPALLYPVLGYATNADGGDGSGAGADGETIWLGLTMPLFGRTPSWR